MTLVNVLAGIAWDPEIRGILSVAVGVVVLIGAVYLLLATNVAHRLGLLLVLAAFFGWMTVHAFVWWVYPPVMGPAGRVPGWEVSEVVIGDLDQALLTDAQGIDLDALPDPETVDEATAAEGEQISEENADALADWDVLAGADANRSDIQTAIDAQFAEGLVPDVSTPDTYVVQYVLEKGGKPERASDAVWDRITNKVANSLRLTHPPHYALVQVQPAIEQEQVVGEAPPTPRADPDAEPISVIVERDLGQRRVPAALVSSGSAMIFGLLCLMLHQRDRQSAENRAAPLPATTGTGV